MPLIDVGAIVGRAAWVRARAGLANADPPYSTHTLIEAAFPDVVVSGADLPHGVYELAERAPGRRSLWYARGVSQAAQRVGLAHGLHHLMTDLREEAGLRECNTMQRQLEVRRVLPANPIEVACDLFAGELLVPFAILDRMAPRDLFPHTPAAQQGWQDEVDRLASLFHVPAGFMRWRLYDLAHLRKTHFYVG